nr:hypothetical protein [Tanacetum cinerariifolium]
LKERVKLLEDREGVAAEGSGDDAPIKGKNLDEGEAATERASNDTEEVETVLTSMDTATVLASGAAEVPTGSRSISTAGPPAVEVPTSSDVVPTASSHRGSEELLEDYKVRRQLSQLSILHRLTEASGEGRFEPITEISEGDSQEQTTYQ